MIRLRSPSRSRRSARLVPFLAPAAAFLLGCDLTPRPNADEIARIGPEPSGYPYRFVVMGDNRIPGMSIFADLLAQTQAVASPAASFGINVGDLVLTGTAGEYGGYVDALAGYPIPFVSGIGNHEQYAPEGEANYRTVFGDEDFTFAHGLSRFVYLDDSNPAGYGLTQAQLDWLDVVLDDPAHPDRYVFMHVPPTLPGAAVTSREANPEIPGDDVYTPLRSGVLSGVGAFAEWPQLVNILEAHQVRIAFFGHLHIYEHSYSNGVHYVITGGAGAEIGLPEDTPPDSGVFHHFMTVTIGADGQSRVELIKHRNGATPSAEYSFDFTTTPVS